MQKWLPLKLLQILEMSLAHTRLTSLENICDVNEMLYLFVFKATRTHTKIIHTKSFKLIQVFFKSVVQKDVFEFWAIWDVQSDA